MRGPCRQLAASLPTARTAETVEHHQESARRTIMLNLRGRRYAAAAEKVRKPAARGRRCSRVLDAHALSDEDRVADAFMWDVG